MRRAARVDANHQLVVAQFKAYGALVLDLSRLGEGIPDLLVGFQGKWRLVEVKDGSQPPSKRRLTKKEDLLAKACGQQVLPWYICNGTEDVSRILGIADEV